MVDGYRFSIVGALLVSLGLVAAGYGVYAGLAAFKSWERFVTVKGLVERVEKADAATTTIAIKLAGNDLPQLYAQLSDSTQKIEAFLNKEGLEKGEITLTSPIVNDNQAYGGQTAPTNRYVIDRSIVLNTTRVDLINSLTGKIGDLVSQGVNISNVSTRFHLKRFSGLRPAMLMEATKNAREMAQQFAKTAGVQLGSVRSANQGLMTITGADSIPGAAYDLGENDLYKKVRLVSTMEFYLKD